METFGSILQIVGIILALGGLALCFACSPLGLIGSVVGFALVGGSELIHIDDEAKLELAAETFKADGQQLIIKTHQESLGPIYDAAMEIGANAEKIQKVYNELEEKSKNVTSSESKKIFSNKLEQLTRQQNKLKASLQNLEKCAFEQVLVKHMENTPGGELGGADFSNSIKEELETVRSVMQEVEKINQN